MEKRSDREERIQKGKKKKTSSGITFLKKSLKITAHCKGRLRDMSRRVKRKKLRSLAKKEKKGKPSRTTTKEKTSGFLLCSNSQVHSKGEVWGGKGK